LNEEVKSAAFGTLRLATKEEDNKKKIEGKRGRMKLNEKLCIQMMVENPVLIERPILIKRTRAIIGRPIEIVEKFIK
jgi:arsenate reductase